MRITPSYEVALYELDQARTHEDRVDALRDCAYAMARDIEQQEEELSEFWADE